MFTSVAPLRFATIALAALAALTAACGGGGFDRQAVIDGELRIGLTQEQAECYADAMEAEFGEDPTADGVVEDEVVSTLLSLKFDCVGGAE